MKKIFFISFFFFAGFFWGKPDYSRASFLLEEMKKADLAGDCESVFKFYSLFLEQKPPLKMKKDAYLSCASCYEKRKAYEQAAAIYKLAIELYPGEKIFLKKACELYLKNGLYSSSLDLALQIEKKDPHDQENWLFLARSYAGLGFWRKSVFYYRQIAALNLNDYEMMFEYCMALKNSADYTESYELALKSAENSLDERFYLLSAEISALSGDLPKALGLLEKTREKGLCGLKCVKMKVVYNFFLDRDEEVLKELNLLQKDEAFRSFMLALTKLRKGENQAAKENFAKAAYLGDGFIKRAAEKYLKEK